MSRALIAHRLGRVEYEDGLALQKRFGEARQKGAVDDVLLLLEHPPVITLGRGGKRAHVVATEIELRDRAVEIFETNRGGDVTYHGPGQIVGYPIFDLAPDRKDVRRYVRDVEESVIRALGRFGIHAHRIARWPGVWLGEEGKDARKICAIGVHLSHWITRHGFALNVNTDLSHFDWIVPCGIDEAGVASMERELGHPVSVPDVEQALAESFAEVFGAALSPPPAPMPTISVTVVRQSPEGARVLLLHRTEARGGFWQLVTGRQERSESPSQTAFRELREETGTELAVMPLDYVHSLPFGDDLPPTVVRETAFFARWPDERAVHLSDEHQSFEWVRPDEAEARLPYVGLREAVRRTLKRI